MRYHPSTMRRLFALLLVTVSLGFGQVAPNAKQGPTVPSLPNANREVVQIAIQDQWDRGVDMFRSRHIPPPDLHGESVVARDAKRRAAIRKLLSEGKVQSGTDYWLSALVFQHATKAEDILLAHVLAVTAAAKGNANGKWLAAASLDRYLWDIGQPQVFGTQFKKDNQGHWTMQPYVPGILSDAERKLWCVVPASVQRTILDDVNHGKQFRSTSISKCE